MNHRKRLGIVILAMLIGGGTALAPFSQASSNQPAGTPLTASTHRAHAVGSITAAHVAAGVSGAPRTTSG